MSDASSGHESDQPVVTDAKKKKDTSSNCQWKPAHDAQLISTLADQKKVGQQSENGWKDLVWTLCADAQKANFPDAPGGLKTAPKCSDHFTNVCLSCPSSALHAHVSLQLKGDYKLVDELANKSGFGWDPVLNKVTAADDVWDRVCKVRRMLSCAIASLLMCHLQANTKYKKWMKKSFPLYPAMRDLVGNTTARGDNLLPLAKKPKKVKKLDKEADKENSPRTAATAKEKVAEKDSSSDDEKVRVSTMCLQMTVVSLNVSMQDPVPPVKRHRAALLSDAAVNISDSSEDEVRAVCS